MTMKKNFFTTIIKRLIDLTFIPVRKNRILLDHVINGTLRSEIGSMSESGKLFPLNHIHKSIRLSQNLVNQDFIILDIGGGVGASLKIFLEQLPGKKIIVFEPVEDSFNAIKQRFPGYNNIEFVRAAAGNDNGEKDIHIAERITSSSLLPLAADPESNVFDDRNLGKVRTEKIRTVRLDNFLSSFDGRIGIMKIDVQGYELDVLKGAENKLGITDIVVLEANNHEGYKGSAKYYEIDSYLRSHNYSLVDIIPSIVDNCRLKEWDMIYLNNLSECV